MVRGDTAAEGYWNQRGKSRRTFQGEWTYTGDTYVRDEEGYFRFQGRSDEMLKVSGVWVSPFEVEEALISHPAVLEAAVIGREDKRRADQAEGVRDLAGSAADEPRDALIADLQAHVKEHVGVWKYPRWIEVVRRCRRPRPARSSASSCGRCDAARHLRLAAERLETAWWGPAPAQAPTLVLLHEGLGCVGCGAMFPNAWPTPPAAACSPIRGSAMAARDPVRCPAR